MQVVRSPAAAAESTDAARIVFGADAAQPVATVETSAMAIRFFFMGSSVRVRWELEHAAGHREFRLQNRRCATPAQFELRKSRETALFRPRVAPSKVAPSSHWKDVHANS